MGRLTPVAIRIGAISWMPKLLPLIVRVDRTLERTTRGRWSLLDIAGLPNLVLTVVGRRSGLPRSTPLLCAPHGDGWLIAGSYFGGPRMPVWVENLRAAGRGEVRVGGDVTAATARELGGEDRAAAWEVLLRTWPNFARYEQRTHRTIPVFELRPADPDPDPDR
jgi:deazaflavin-dependent oxidoreductase (nitroreductase family)